MSGLIINPVPQFKNLGVISHAPRPPPHTWSSKKLLVLLPKYFSKSSISYQLHCQPPGMSCLHLPSVGQQTRNSERPPPSSSATPSNTRTIFTEHGSDVSPLLRSLLQLSTVKDRQDAYCPMLPGCPLQPHGRGLPLGSLLPWDAPPPLLPNSHASFRPQLGHHSGPKVTLGSWE